MSKAFADGFDGIQITEQCSQGCIRRPFDDGVQDIGRGGWFPAAESWMREECGTVVGGVYIGDLLGDLALAVPHPLLEGECEEENPITGRQQLLR